MEAARAERAALAPWRAAIAGARLVKRAALAARRAARIAKCRQRPYGASAGAGTDSANRTEAVAAVDAGLAPAGRGAAAGGEPGIDAIVQRPFDASTGAGMSAAGNAPKLPGGSTCGAVPQRIAGSTPGTSAPPGQDARWQALVGQGLPAMTACALAVTEGAPAATECTPAIAKIENNDKDPMDRRTVQWPWGGLKGRLCGTTTLSGQPRGVVAQAGTWQAVLEASNAEQARKVWTLHAFRPLA